MVENTEELLPKELLLKSMKSGNEFGWKLEDVKYVVEACKKMQFALLGGQTQYLFPDGTCELYWLGFSTKQKEVGETWNDYSERSCNEFQLLFNELVARTDFEKEGLDWLFIKGKKEAGINISDYLCFIMYPVTENEYLTLHEKNK